jgi:hypothetical protein
MAASADLQSQQNFYGRAEVAKFVYPAIVTGTLSVMSQRNAPLRARARRL